MARAVLPPVKASRWRHSNAVNSTGSAVASLRAVRARHKPASTETQRHAAHATLVSHRGPRLRAGAAPPRCFVGTPCMGIGGPEDQRAITIQRRRRPVRTHTSAQETFHDRHHPPRQRRTCNKRVHVDSPPVAPKQPDAILAALRAACTKRGDRMVRMRTYLDTRSATTPPKHVVRSRTFQVTQAGRHT